jgi:hypothetical protein
MKRNEIIFIALALLWSVGSGLVLFTPNSVQGLAWVLLLGFFFLGFVPIIVKICKKIKII